jgi:hypothetical protein
MRLFVMVSAALACASPPPPKLGPPTFCFPVSDRNDPNVQFVDDPDSVPKIWGNWFGVGPPPDGCMTVVNQRVAPPQ